jgi:hypothetical protein
MKPEEGCHPGRGRSWPRPHDQAARSVAYLDFLLRVLSECVRAASRVSRTQTRLFLATLPGSSGRRYHSLQPQALEEEHKVIPRGVAEISGCIHHVNHGCSRRARGRKIPFGFSRERHTGAGRWDVIEGNQPDWPARVAGNCAPVFGANRGRTKPLGLRLTETPGVRSACARPKLQNRRGSFERGRPSPPAPNYAAAPTPCAHRVGKGAIYAGNELARSRIRAMIEGEPIP